MSLLVYRGTRNGRSCFAGQAKKHTFRELHRDGEWRAPRAKVGRRINGSFYLDYSHAFHLLELFSITLRQKAGVLSRPNVLRRKKKGKRTRRKERRKNRKENDKNVDKRCAMNVRLVFFPQRLVPIIMTREKSGPG